MPDSKRESSMLARLRREAEARLKDGSAPATVGWSVGVNALGLLHELASRPDSAVDALKLLHELQVYQIELDLQHEQIESSHRDMTEDMTHYRELFERAPAAYLKLNAQRDIIDSNMAATKLFLMDQEKLRGRSMEALLAAGSRADFTKLLKRLSTDGTSDSCEIQVNAASGSRKCRLLASRNSVDETVLIMLVVPAKGS